MQPTAAPDGGGAGPRIRVLFLNTSTRPPLGADTWIHLEIMRRLDRRTIEPIMACAWGRAGAPTPTYTVAREIPDLEVLSADMGPELDRRSAVQKVRGLVATLPALWTVARLARTIRRRDIQLIHTSDRPRDAFAAVVLARLTRTHCVVHVHVGYNPDWMGRLLRWSLHHAGTLVAISAFVGTTLTEAGIDPRRIVVVPNGIDVERWRPGANGARRGLGIGPDTPLLLTVCRLFPDKGPGDVIEAVARLRRRFPDVRLLIVGLDVTGGSFSAQLRARVAELDLGEHVSFLGRRDDVEALMAACDVYVMPSHLEPFGLVFCEAMAMQRPVVALADGGTVEIVEDGRTGLLSARGDLDALTRNLEILLADPARRATMGDAGRRAVEARFTTQRMADDVAAVYRAISSPLSERALVGNEGDRG